jgi:hypothetical protein
MQTLTFCGEWVQLSQSRFIAKGASKLVRDASKELEENQEQEYPIPLT